MFLIFRGVCGNVIFVRGVLLSTSLDTGMVWLCAQPGNCNRSLTYPVIHASLTINKVRKQMKGGERALKADCSGV